MKKEGPKVIALLESYEKAPKSIKYPLTSHIVIPSNRFANELGRAGEVIEEAFKEHEEVVLVANTDASIIAVAAFAHYPEIRELVTFWPAFDYAITPFEREGAVWLKKNEEKVAPVRDRITTVYTNAPELQEEHLFEGARQIVVKSAAPDWREGLKRLMWRPVEGYFNPDLQNS